MSTLHLTRLAPTPSGYLHLGNVASFVITAGLAKKHGAKILLRIDDMDRDRVRPEYVQDIFDTLHFLDIPWHEGPRDAAEFERAWSQLRRMGLYQEALLNLVDGGQVFACSCSRTDLARDSKDGSYPGTCIHKHIPLDMPDVAWRLRTPEEGPGSDLPASVRHFIVRKKDGDPAYQLTSVVDDLHYGVDLIVRGEDLADSSLAQSYLATQLPDNAFGKILFHHHPLMSESDGAKMSKSAGATSIHYLKEHGATAREIFTQIAKGYGREGAPENWEELYALLSL